MHPKETKYLFSHLLPYHLLPAISRPEVVIPRSRLNLTTKIELFWMCLYALHVGFVAMVKIHEHLQRLFDNKGHISKLDNLKQQLFFITTDVNMVALVSQFYARVSRCFLSLAKFNFIEFQLPRTRGKIDKHFYALPQTIIAEILAWIPHVRAVDFHMLNDEACANIMRFVLLIGHEEDMAFPPLRVTAINAIWSYGTIIDGDTSSWIGRVKTQAMQNLAMEAARRLYIDCIWTDGMEKLCFVVVDGSPLTHSCMCLGDMMDRSTCVL
jgi:hypothetical protein